jgi:hypothetical protein
MISGAEDDMRGPRFLIGLLAVGSLLSAGGACSRANQAAGEISPANMITVVVKNENFLDMDVYAVSQGLATRLGTVTGNGTRTFLSDASMAAQDFRIVATPIGGNGRASTGALVVSPGQTVDFRIGSTMRNSSVFIR